MDKGTDAEILAGDRVVVTLGGRPFVFDEPVRRKARTMRADAMALIARSLDHFPVALRDKLLLTGKLDDADVQEASATGGLSIQQAILVKADAIQLKDAQLAFLEKHVLGLAGNDAAAHATDDEIDAAFKSVMAMISRVYELAKKNGIDGTNPTNTTKAAPTS